MKRFSTLSLAALLLAGLAAGGAAQTQSQAPGTSKNPLPRGAKRVSFVQKLGDKVPLDARFTDASGHEISLGDAIAGKPTILALVYFECPMLCTQTLNGLTRCLRVVSLDVGKDFRVVTLSFNPRETPKLAAAKKASYLDFYKRKGAESGWKFLTGKEKQIKRVTEAAGFHYQYHPDTGQYAHAAGIVVLAADGTISRYFYGIEFDPRDVKLGLVDASKGEVGSVVDQLLLLCLQYDPSTGKYSVAILAVLRIFGFLTVAGLAVLIFVLVRRGKPASETPRAEGREAIPEPHAHPTKP